MDLRIPVVPVLVTALFLGAGALAITWKPAPPPPPPPYKATPDDELAAKRALGLLLVLGSPPAPEPVPEAVPWDPDLALRVVSAAKKYLAQRPPSAFRDDCSGYVSAIYSEAGIPMDGHVRSLWDMAEQMGALHWDRPRPGDLVFFDDSYDTDHDGDWDDPLTHVGVVLQVFPDGHLIYANGGTSRGRVTGVMDTERSWMRDDEVGERVNTYVREPAWDDPPGAQYLAGALWAGYARPSVGQNWLE